MVLVEVVYHQHSQTLQVNKAAIQTYRTVLGYNLSKVAKNNLQDSRIMRVVCLVMLEARP